MPMTVAGKAADPSLVALGAVAESDGEAIDVATDAPEGIALTAGPGGGRFAREPTTSATTTSKVAADASPTPAEKRPMRWDPTSSSLLAIAALKVSCGTGTSARDLR